jgi:hypothetical protein
MEKSNEDILDEVILVVSGLEYFCLNEYKLSINDDEYFTQGLSISQMKDLIISNGGIVITVINMDEYPVSILGNYSNYSLIKINKSPVNIEEESYRYSDISYYFVAGNGCTKIGKFISTKNIPSDIIKITREFRLLSTKSEYVGI